jgi:hypothetical protein
VSADKRWADAHTDVWFEHPDREYSRPGARAKGLAPIGSWRRAALSVSTQEPSVWRSSFARGLSTLGIEDAFTDETACSSL